MIRALRIVSGFLAVILMFGLMAAPTMAASATKITASVSSKEVLFNQPITITAQTTPATQVSYMKVFNKATGAQVGRIEGAFGKFTWTPNQAGTYQLRAWAYAKGTLSYLAFYDFAVTVRPDERAELAAQILNSSNIRLAASHSSGRADRAFALSNIKDTATGVKAKTSCYGTSPCSEVNLSVPMLKALVALANKYSFEVSEISGGGHSAGSLHYSGRAVDISRINGVAVSSKHPTWKAFKTEALRLGAQQVLGPGDKDHDDHLHLSFSR